MIIHDILYLHNKITHHKIYDTASWIGYSLDGAENITITGSVELIGISEGSHRIIIYANDTLGNIGSSSELWFSIDIPPNTTSTIDTSTSDQTTPPSSNLSSTTNPDNTDTLTSLSTPGFSFMAFVSVMILGLIFKRKR